MRVRDLSVYLSPTEVARATAWKQALDDRATGAAAFEELAWSAALPALADVIASVWLPPSIVVCAHDAKTLVLNVSGALLRALDAPADEDVEAQLLPVVDCTAAYWIKPGADCAGGAILSTAYKWRLRGDDVAHSARARAVHEEALPSRKGERRVRRRPANVKWLRAALVSVKRAQEARECRQIRKRVVVDKCVPFVRQRMVCEEGLHLPPLDEAAVGHIQAVIDVCHAIAQRFARLGAVGAVEELSTHGQHADELDRLDEHDELAAIATSVAAAMKLGEFPS